MEYTEKIDELAKALTQAQAEFEEVKKSGHNPHLNTNYATNDDVLNAVGPALRRNNLTVVQPIGCDDNGDITITTMVIHNSGQHISDTTIIQAPKSRKGINAIQALGSAITYMRRYTLCSMLLVGGQPDDDAHNAGSVDGEEEEETESSNKREELRAEWANLVEEAKEAGVKKEDYPKLGPDVPDEEIKRVLEVFKEVIAETVKRKELQKEWSRLTEEAEEAGVSEEKYPKVSPDMTNKQIEEALEKFKNIVEVDL